MLVMRADQARFSTKGNSRTNHGETVTGHAHWDYGMFANRK